MLPFEVQHFSTGTADTAPSFHADTVHHVEFDFYGQRVATVSSDKTVCIWDKDTQNGAWRKSASWKKHGGAVWKVRFAHPEYGQVLATCSFDNTIQIFDKDAADLSEIRPITGADSSNGWACRTVLRQSNASASITDIQFAPHYLGLQLAACTSSGRLIIYEAEDIMALDNWNVLHDYEVTKNRLSSLSWSTNRFDPPHIVVSSDDVDAAPAEKVFLFRVNSSCGLVRLNPTAAGGGDGKQFNFTDQVSAVCFGPSCGLAQHKLAVAVGAKVAVFQLVSGPNAAALFADDSNGDESVAPIMPMLSMEDGRAQTGDETSSAAVAAAELTINGCEVLEEGNAAQVVRLSWNVIGDVISAVYSDGIIRVWRYIFSNRWILATTITPPAEQNRSAKDDVYY
ncbi:hypothetical protein niasHT_038154 [Heterodera trifolii]|uniref:Nucleoporin SEH1 n=1 Tax=Heterodera trifolii TaxID=157864 RepID=A0ABD2IB49_9BILA